MSTDIILTPKPREDQMNDAYQRAIRLAAATTDPEAHYAYVQQANALWREWRAMQVSRQDEESQLHGLLVAFFALLIAVFVFSAWAWFTLYP